MFIGHYGVGFAGKRAAPRVSLGWWFLAVQLVDLLWPIFLLLGGEEVRIHPGDTVLTPLEFRRYPITHSLAGGVGWGLLLALVYRAFKGTRRDAVWLGCGVVSHWLLDAIVHRPDLPLFPGGATRIGLGLWNHVAATLVLELGLFFAGLALYLRITRARGVSGHVSLWSFVVVILLIYVQSLFGPPPPDERSLAWFALIGWLVPPWGLWIDRTRRSDPA
jgi:hypothetical protein